MKVKTPFREMLLSFRRQFLTRIRNVWEDDHAQIFFGLWLIMLWILVFIIFYIKPFSHNK